MPIIRKNELIYARDIDSNLHATSELPRIGATTLSQRFTAEIGTFSTYGENVQDTFLT
jgi:hypothetical protein